MTKPMNVDSAAITIQKVYRGFFARKKFFINQCTNPTDYKIPQALGNDPVFGKDLESQALDKPFALIGCSGMRNLFIALQLIKTGCPFVPKLIILDNSREVINDWRKFREEVAADGYDAQAFMKNLYHLYGIAFKKVALLKNTKYGNISVGKTQRGKLYGKWLTQILHYIQDNEEKFTSNFAIIKKMITSSAIICGSWEDPDILRRIKNILSKIDINDIVAYPSNIYAYLDTQNRGVILNNIFILNPVLTIHTNLRFVDGGTKMRPGVPSRYFLIKGNDPQKVAKILTDASSQKLLNEGLTINYRDSVFTSKQELFQSLVQDTDAYMKLYLETEMKYMTKHGYFDGAIYCENEEELSSFLSSYCEDVSDKKDIYEKELEKGDDYFGDFEKSDFSFRI